jgi:hypothetical protein
MTKLNLQDKINTALSITAIAFSALSFWFSYYTYSQSKEERIAVSSGIVFENYPTKVYKIVNDLVIPLYWNVTISNNSDKNISIVNIKVVPENSPRDVLYYTRMYNGLYSDNNNPVELPINLNSGESKKYLISLGILCDTSASNILKKEFKLINKVNLGSGLPIKYFSILKAFIKHKKDFYGNKIDGELLDDGSGYIKHEPNNKQKMTVTFVSSNNTNVIQVFSLY